MMKLFRSIFRSRAKEWLAALIVLAASTTYAQTLTMTEFGANLVPNLGGCSVGNNSITAGTDGNLWVSRCGGVTRVTPNGFATKFNAPDLSSAKGITTGSDGNVWVTGAKSISRITPNGVWTTFPYDGGGDVYLTGITAGPDGNVWATGRVQIPNTLNIKAVILRVTPSGVITEFSMGYVYEGSLYIGITSGPDGNLWFTGHGGIGRVTTTGVITWFPVPVSPGYKWNVFDGITTGADGNLWVAGHEYEGGASVIVRITPGGEITKFPLALRSLNQGWIVNITSGPDENIWFTVWGYGLGRITPSGEVTYFNTGLPSLPSLNGITWVRLFCATV